MLRYTELRQPGQIAVISPYKEQVRLVKTLFVAQLGKDMAQGIDVNTIDGFQVLNVP
jgi:senataxin